MVRTRLFGLRLRDGLMRRNHGWWPNSSILDPGLGWDPWSVWPVVGLCGASLNCGSFYLSFWTGDTAFWGRYMAIWGCLYTSSGTAPLSGVLSSISLSPCLECSPARIVATGGLLRFQVVASIAPLTVEGHLWACHSLLSVWVPSRAESWVPCSPELSQQPHALLVGRASIAPLTIEGHLWACRSLLSGWLLSHAESWVPLSPELSQ